MTLVLLVAAVALCTVLSQDIRWSDTMQDIKGRQSEWASLAVTDYIYEYSRHPWYVCGAFGAEQRVCAINAEQRVLVVLDSVRLRDGIQRTSDGGGVRQR